MLRIPFRAAAAALTVLGLTGLAACGGTQSPTSGTSSGTGDEQVTLSYAWWGDDARAEKTEAAIDLFEAAHPNIKVNTSFAAFDAYNQKLTTQLAGGGAPDVFMVDKSYAEEWASKGLLADLSGLTIDTTDIPDAYVAAGVIAGKHVGIPPAGTSQAMAYNADLWQQAGLEPPAAGFSWEDLKAAAPKISEASGGKAAVLSDPGKYTDWFNAWLFQQGKELYSESGELTATQQDIHDYWAFTTGLLKDGVVSTPQVTASMDGTAATSGLVTGASAAEFSPASAVAGFISATTAKLGFAHLPTDTDKSGMFLTPSQMFAISANSQHQQAAAQFIDFMVNDVEAGKALLLARGLPVNSKVLAAIRPMLSEADAALADFVDSVTEVAQQKSWVEPAGASASKTEFARIYEELIFDKTTLDDAAARMYEVFVENDKE